MRAPGTLGQPLVARLVEHFTALATRDNNSSPNLSHTEMLRPSDSPLFVEAAALIAPKLVDFGVHLFGERMRWLLKEMWVNVLDTGGRQAMHNHANSFISGVVYLTPTHPGSQTVFMKSPGGTDFLFKNDHAGRRRASSAPTSGSARRPQPGDMVLFPSYLMHAVPPNQGERRITLSFNAIPSQLDSWGYVVRFSVEQRPRRAAPVGVAGADGGLRLCRAGLPDRLDAAMRLVAGSRVRRRAGGGGGVLRRAGGGRADARLAHRAQRAPCAGTPGASWSSRCGACCCSSSGRRSAAGC